MSTKRIGILAAMPEELEQLKKVVTNQTSFPRGEAFTFTTGELHSKPVVFAAANVGMVFAGSAATTMIGEFGACAIIFTGVAGGLREGQQIGDVVVGQTVVNYEMDCRSFTYPWDPSYKLHLGELPFVNWRFFEADPSLLKLALEAPVPEGLRVTAGLVASGSIFLDTAKKQGMYESVWKPLGEPLCAEMENAAVAQICRAYSVPYVSLRALSDLLTGDAAADFHEFCIKVADTLIPIVQYVVEKYIIPSA
uniref:adenosylhomocysteine nucleosidase n=1 Tax=Chrysotila carterae TaxID=13221 RepID=A0A7S4C034_CHRCT